MQFERLKNIFTCSRAQIDQLSQRVCVINIKSKMSMQGWEPNGDQSIIMQQNNDEEASNSVQDLYEQMLFNEDPIQINENVKIFTDIIWLVSEKIDDHEKLRNKIFMDSFKLMYGKHFKQFVAGPDVLEYLQTMKMKPEEILQKQSMLEKEIRNYRAVYTALFICSNDTLSFFSNKLCLLEHIYTKCLGFRLEPKYTEDLGEFLYRNVKQAYDFLSAVAALEKQIGVKGEVSVYQMFKEFNIYLSKDLDDQGQRQEEKHKQENMLGAQKQSECQNQREQQQDQQLKKQEQQFYEKQSKLQEQEQLTQKAHQKQQKQQHEICQLREMIQLKIGKQLLETDIYIPLDMEKVNFIIMTTNMAKQQLADISSQNYIIKTVEQFNSYLTIESQLPKIILITTEVENCFELIDNYAEIVYWIRCCWGRSKLSEEELIEAFDEKYGSVSDVHPDYDGRVINVHSLEQFCNWMQEICEKVQSII